MPARTHSNSTFGQLREPKLRLCLYLLASGSLLSVAHTPSSMRPIHFTEEQKQREAEEESKGEKKNAASYKHTQTFVQ